MDRTLFCRHEDCRVGYVSVAGDLPAICPRCLRASQWTTMAPAVGSPGTIYPGDPKSSYRLTFTDEKFLRSLRITPD